MFEVGKKYRFHPYGLEKPDNGHMYFFLGLSKKGKPVFETPYEEVFWSDQPHLYKEYKEPVKVSGWMNIYKNGPHEATSRRTFYQTKKLADFYAGSNRIACIYVSGEEGKEP